MTAPNDEALSSAAGVRMRLEFAAGGRPVVRCSGCGYDVDPGTLRIDSTCEARGQACVLAQLRVEAGMRLRWGRR